MYESTDGKVQKKCRVDEEVSDVRGREEGSSESKDHNY